MSVDLARGVNLICVSIVQVIKHYITELGPRATTPSPWTKWCQHCSAAKRSRNAGRQAGRQEGKQATQDNQQVVMNS